MHARFPQTQARASTRHLTMNISHGNLFTFNLNYLRRSEGGQDKCGAQRKQCCAAYGRCSASAVASRLEWRVRYLLHRLLLIVETVSQNGTQRWNNEPSFAQYGEQCKQRVSLPANPCFSTRAVWGGGDSCKEGDAVASLPLPFLM